MVWKCIGMDIQLLLSNPINLKFIKQIYFIQIGTVRINGVEDPSIA